MRIEVIENEENVTLRMDGELTINYIKLAYETLLKYFTTHKTVVLEFVDVDEVDLSFFQLLFYIGEKANKDGISFAIRNNSELIKTKILEAGLDGKIAMPVEKEMLYESVTEEESNG